MKKIYTIFGIIVILVIIFYFYNTFVKKETPPVDTSPVATTTVQNTVQEQIPVQVTPISHATAVLKWDDMTIVTDPTGTSTALLNQTPNIILITDIHGDHLSTSTLASLKGTATIIAPKAVADLLPTTLSSRTKVLANSSSITEQGFTITAVPMYNTPEATDSRHTKGRGNGYIIEKNGFRVYVAGDTDGTSEMKALTDIDIAFIPMNPPFTMDVEEAAEAVLAFKPQQVYPYHYRGQNGLSDVNKFKQLVDAGNQDIEVMLVNWYPTQ